MTPAGADLGCRELVELVTDYLEETLPIEERARFESHLAGCDGCRTYLQQMREVLDTAGRLREESLAPAARDALLAAFRTWKSGSGSGR